MNTVNELIISLNELYEMKDIIPVNNDDTNIFYFDTDFNHLTLKKVLNLSNELLITDQGLCNWNNIKILRSNGYRVYAGEKDSFGWLTGCIRKDNYVLVYG